MTFVNYFWTSIEGFVCTPKPFKPFFPVPFKRLNRNLTIIFEYSALCTHQRAGPYLSLKYGAMSTQAYGRGVLDPSVYHTMSTGCMISLSWDQSSLEGKKMLEEQSIVTSEQSNN